MSIYFSRRYQYRIHKPTSRPKSIFQNDSLQVSKVHQPALSTSVDIIALLVNHGLFHVIEEILLLLSLSLSDIRNFQLVSRLWLSLLEDDNGRFWKLLLERKRKSRDIIRSPNQNFTEKPNKLEVEKLISLEKRWCHDTPFEQRVEFNSFVLCLLVLNPDWTCSQVLVGLNNGCLEEWILGKDRRRLRSKELHNKGIKCLSSSKNHLFTGSYDGSVRVWDLSTWQAIATLTHHSDAVWDLKTFDRKLVSCGTDGRVCVLNIENESLPIIHMISTEPEIASNLDLDDKFVVTGYDNGNIAVWEVNQNDLQHIHALEGHTQGVTCVKIDKDILASGSYDCRVRLWNIPHGVCLAILQGHKDLVRSLDIANGRVVSGDFSGFLKIWDLTSVIPASKQHMKAVIDDDKPTYEPLIVLSHRSLFTHRGHVTVVKISGESLWSGSREKNVVFQCFMRD